MKMYLKIIGTVVSLIILSLLVWFFFFMPAGSTTTVGTSFFGTRSTVSVPVTPAATDTPVNQGGSVMSTQKIFKIVDGPIAGATFVQTFNPTTTVARYVMQDNGHVFDLPVDVPGSMPRSVSNTTIPGVVNALWGEKGTSVLLQYKEEFALKTVHVAFTTQIQTSTATPQTAPVTPLRIRFLPDNIAALTVSPDGKKVAYLMLGGGGAIGYIANLDGTESRMLFTLPLKEVLLSWPAQNTLLVQTKSAAQVPGIAFSVNVRDGAIVPLLYAPGLSATADNTFSKVVYQTTNTDRTTYAHDTATGRDVPLSFQPLPEKCIWSMSARSFMYCATPMQYVAPNYLDMWHQGLASAPDTLFAFNVSTGATLLLGTPGGTEGGVSSDITQLAVAPEERYLSFITKGDRSLWGVRLTQ